MAPGTQQPRAQLHQVLPQASVARRAELYLTRSCWLLSASDDCDLPHVDPTVLDPRSGVAPMQCCACTTQQCSTVCCTLSHARVVRVTSPASLSLAPARLNPSSGSRSPTQPGPIGPAVCCVLLFLAPPHTQGTGFQPSHGTLCVPAASSVLVSCIIDFDDIQV